MGIRVYRYLTPTLKSAVRSNVGLHCMTDANQLLASRIFSDIRERIPSARSIAKAALESTLSSYADPEGGLKSEPSEIISLSEKEAYRLYLDEEKRASGLALANAIRAEAESGDGDDAFSQFIENRFAVIDRLCLSLAQSRKSRAGSTFEELVSSILDRLGYPYSGQAVIKGGKPDYILPSIDHYGAYPSDCIVLTCKRTLRERWRQIVTEGVTGTFFLATLDEGINSAQATEMNDRRVTMVVPAHIKSNKYQDFRNVISFEYFFQHHMEPAMARWRESGVVED